MAAAVAPAAAQSVATATATAAAGSEADEPAKGSQAYGGLVDDDVMLLFEKLQLELMLGGAEVA
jgi:hypothetical protein